MPDVIAVLCFVANLAFLPFSFIDGTILSPSVDFFVLVPMFSLFVLAAGRFAALRIASVVRLKRAVLRICSLAFLAVPTLQGIAILLGFSGLPEYPLLIGAVSEFVGLLLYGFAPPASCEEKEPGGVRALAVFTLGVCGTYGLMTGAGISDHDSSPLLAILLRVLYAGCVGGYFRERKSEKLNLLLGAGVVIGVQFALTLGMRADVAGPFLPGLACLCLMLSVLLRGTPKDNSDSAPEEPRQSSEEAALGSFGFSEGERKAVELTLAGMTSSEAALKMGLKAPTVRSYLQRAYKKAGVTSFGELKQRLLGVPENNEDEIEKKDEDSTIATTLLIPLLIGLVYLLPSGGVGLPASSLYAWAPAGVFILLAFNRINLWVVTALGTASSMLIGSSFVVASADPAMGWTAEFSALIGISSASLTYCTAGVFFCCREKRSIFKEMRPGYQIIFLLICLAMLVLSGFSGVSRGVLVCLSGSALFLPLTLYSKRSMGSVSGELAGNLVDNLAAFYMGVAACDASMGHYLFFSHLLAMPFLLLVIVAQAVELSRITSFLSGGRTALLVALVSLVALAMKDGCVAILVAAILFNALCIGISVGDVSVSRQVIFGAALGVVLALCVERLDYVSPAAADFALRTAMGKTVLRTLAFDAGSLLIGIAFLADSLFRGKAPKSETSADARALQYLQARGLTELEARIMLAVVHGEGPLSIARSQSCAPGTINSAKRKAYGLLGVHSKSELVTLLQEHLRTSF